MCYDNKPDPPKPAPVTPPAPILDQVAPKKTNESQRKARSNRKGTKRYRTGGALAIPSSSAARNSGLNIPGGG